VHDCGVERTLALLQEVLKVRHLIYAGSFFQTSEAPRNARGETRPREVPAVEAAVR
jgi:hypothetical protein